MQANLEFQVDDQDVMTLYFTGSISKETVSALWKKIESLASKKAQ